MRADHYFWIGKTHNVCQDYALSKSTDDIDYVILCDGCSSSPDTDFGARILSKAAAFYIEKSYDPNLFAELVINKAQTHAKALDLSSRCLDATILTAARIGDNIYVNMFGDGVVKIKTKHYEKTFTANFPQNAPYYPSYLINKEGNETIKNIIKLHNRSIYNVHYVSDSTEFINDYYPKNENLWCSWILNKDDVEYIALMSDGVESFEKVIKTDTSIVKDPVNYRDITNELLDFKSNKGEFVKRRSLSCIKKFNKENFQNSDDVSIAVLYNENYSK